MYTDRALDGRPSGQGVMSLMTSMTQCWALSHL